MIPTEMQWSSISIDSTREVSQVPADLSVLERGIQLQHGTRSLPVFDNRSGALLHRSEGRRVAFLVLNSYNSPRTTGLQNLGRNGVFLYAQAVQATTFFGLPGRQLVAGLFGTGSFSDLSPASFIELPLGAALRPERTVPGPCSGIWISDCEAIPRIPTWALASTSRPAWAMAILTRFAGS